MKQFTSSLQSTLSAIDDLRPARVAGQPMLKQAVVLLWGIGRAVNEQKRLLPWHETRAALAPLLEEYRRAGERAVGRPDYPIAALYRANLWELHNHDGRVPTAHGDSYVKAWFDDQRPESGLPLAVWELMRGNPEARRQAVRAVRTKFMLDAEGDRLIHAVGLDPIEFLD